jgi:hypothetical protein
MKRNLLMVALASMVAGQAFGFSTILTTEHADIGVGYEGGVWDLHLHDEDNDVELEADETLVFVGPDARVAQPGSSTWNFLGAGAGNDVWILPQTQNNNLVFLGVAGEEIEPNVFDGNAVNLFLSAVRPGSGTGHFSIYSTDSFGSPTVRMSTFDGISAADVLPVPVGGHAHYNYAFTGTGIWEVDLFAQGFINGQAVTSDVQTYYFGVEAVPEPATMTVLAAAGLAAFLRKQRK